MADSIFMKAEEVMKALGVSQSEAYRIIVEGINTYFSYYYGFSSEAFIVIDGTQIRIP